MDGWRLALWGLLYGGGVACAFLTLVALRHMWGFYLLLSRDYGVEMGIAVVAGLALLWVVREAIKGD